MSGPDELPRSDRLAQERTARARRQADAVNRRMRLACVRTALGRLGAGAGVVRPRRAAQALTASSRARRPATSTRPGAPGVA